MKKRNESSLLLNVLRSGKSILPRATVAHCESGKVKKNGIKGNGHRGAVAKIFSAIIVESSFNRAANRLATNTEELIHESRS